MASAKPRAKASLKRTAAQKMTTSAGQKKQADPSPRKQRRQTPTARDTATAEPDVPAVDDVVALNDMQPSTTLTDPFEEEPCAVNTSSGDGASSAIVDSSDDGGENSSDEEFDAEGDQELLKFKDELYGDDDNNDGHDGDKKRVDLKLDDATEKAIKAKTSLLAPRGEKAEAATSADKHGVLYLGRIPHGFYEEQMRNYFSQFGDVTRLRLSRNKKTGNSKHYAFLEFADADVARIVADTMDNYLLFGHMLKCKVLTPDEVHPKLWVGANREFRAVPWKKLYRAKFNRVKTDEELAANRKNLQRRDAKLKRKLSALGIEYEYAAYCA